MKKTISIILSVLLVLSAGVIGVGAEILPVEPTYVYVTIADQNGKTVLAATEITVTDSDDDGKLTINDVLYCAHEEYYDGGAKAGYATKQTEYGLSLDKLWGSANGGSYGYYVNNVSAWSLTDPINGGEYVAAFCYTDLKGWSDHYSFFDRFQGDVAENEEITLTYNEAAYDKDWNPVTLPVEGATVTVDGQATEFKTDADGKVTLSLNGAGRHIVSAKVEGKTLVAPVFAAFVFKKADVYVTIADQNGNTPVAARKIAVTDIDMDNALTINDALYCAHEEYYDGGARAGYATKKTEYGLSLDKLWGSANGGSYGYYVNNASAWSLTDPVNEGDYLAAFCYTDLKGWSDHYSYFDKFNTTADTGEEFTVTYNEAAYDKDWNPITLPVEGATIAVDGQATEIKTDAEGKARLSIDKPGTHIVSATVEGKTLVAPVLVAKIRSNVKGDADMDGEVTVLDATRIQRWIADLETDDNIDLINANADGDDEVTILDATRIQRFVADLITEL